jgi:ammonia channel protein AmtB
LKNLIHALIGGIIWWAWGFAFAYGNVDGGFIGSKYFLGMDLSSDDKYAEWLF